MYKVIMKAESFNDRAWSKPAIPLVSVMLMWPRRKMEQHYHDPWVPLGFAFATGLAFAPAVAVITGVPVTSVLVELATIGEVALTKGFEIGVTFPVTAVAPLAIEFADDATFTVAIAVERVALTPETVAFPFPTPLPPLTVVVAAPDAENVVEVDWVPLTEVTLEVDVAAVVTVALPFPLEPPFG
jgi:hypothetical protein